MNGSLIAILCIAYFVLIACALSLTRAADLGDHALENADNDAERVESERVIAYARSSTDHDAESRRVAQLIGATVMGLQQGDRHRAGGLRPVRVERRSGPSDRPCTRPQSSRRNVRV